jgi:hypothetical protein
MEETMNNPSVNIMSNEGTEVRSNQDLRWIVFIMAVAIVFFELWMATTDHDNSRDQHLGGAVAFAKGHIDLMRPMILGFNANGSPTPLEFPLWQGLTAALMKLFGLWYGWGNVVSLVFFFSSLWAVFDLCRRMCSVRVAWWTVLFLLIQPLSLIVGGQAGGDSTAWAFAVWFIYLSERMMTEGRWSWWLLAIVIGIMSATIKAPFFMCAGLTAFFWLLYGNRRSRRAWWFLVSAGGIIILVMMAWNYHCHLVYAEAKFPEVDMDAFKRESGIHRWYFGTLAYRLDWHNWLRGGWHLITGVFGGLTFIFLVIVAVRLEKTAWAWLWMVASAITTMIFTPLLLGHLHYFFIFSVPAAWLCASTMAKFESVVWSQAKISVLARIVVILLTLMVTLAGTLMNVHINMYFDTYYQDIGRQIKNATHPTDKLVVWATGGTVWSTPFLRSDREGVMGGLDLDSTVWFDQPGNLTQLKELGYNKIVMINPSPFVVALTSVTGKHGEAIVNLHDRLPSVAKNWPVVYNNAQLLIVEIPR